MLIRGLKRLETPSNDDEAVAAALGTRVLENAPAFQDQLRQQMIETFPSRAEVRQIALEDLTRRDGNVGSIAASYAKDSDMCARVLKVIGALDEATRGILMANIQLAAPSNEAARAILISSREDTDGAVLSEAMIGWVETELARGSFQPEDVETLVSELDAVGPQFHERRTAAVVGLTLSGHLDRFAKAKRYDGKPLDVRAHPRLRKDDTFLRRLLPYWNELRSVLGSEQEIFQRLSLSPETALQGLQPGIPHADHLFKLLLEKIPSAQHVPRHEHLELLARFEPQGNAMREAIMPLLLEPGSNDYAGVGRTYADYWAHLLAAEIFAEYFAGDVTLRKQVIDHFAAHPKSATAAAALAELCLRQEEPELETFLAEKAKGNPYPRGTHFKLLAALAPADEVAEGLEKTLSYALDPQEWVLKYWVPSMIRRIKSDTELQEAMYTRLAQPAPASVKASFPALLGRASGTTERLRLYATAELAHLDQEPIPLVGFDLATYVDRPVFHVLTELIS